MKINENPSLKGTKKIIIFIIFSENNNIKIKAN